MSLSYRRIRLPLQITEIYHRPYNYWRLIPKLGFLYDLQRKFDSHKNRCGRPYFDNDQLLAVAKSNRFHTGKANGTILNVVSPASARVVEKIHYRTFSPLSNGGPDGATLYLTNSVFPSCTDLINRR
jgi:hypothetical protein